MLDQALFGKRIRERRKAQGLTQDEVGQALGVSAQAVSKWEQGESLPDVTLLPSLCHVLGVSADKLLGIEAVGIESLSQGLGRHIHQRRGREREAVLMSVLPWLHQSAPPGTREPSRAGEGTSVNYYWEEDRLQTLQLWSDRGFACYVSSGILTSQGVSEEVLAMLRTLVRPGCWGVALALLAGPKRESDLPETAGSDAPDGQDLPGDGQEALRGGRDALRELIDAGLVVHDRKGYRLEERDGVTMTAVTKALASISDFNCVGQLFYRPDSV